MYLKNSDRSASPKRPRRTAVLDCTILEGRQMLSAAGWSHHLALASAQFDRQSIHQGPSGHHQNVGRHAHKLTVNAAMNFPAPTSGAATPTSVSPTTTAPAPAVVTATSAPVVSAADTTAVSLALAPSAV